MTVGELPPELHWDDVRGFHHVSGQGEAAPSSPDRTELDRLVRRSIEAFDAMTPEQQAEHREAQRRSWVRGMTAKCEHGVIDFEQCPDCRGWNK